MNKILKLSLIIIAASIQLPQLLNASGVRVVHEARARREASTGQRAGIHANLNPIQTTAAQSGNATIPKMLARSCNRVTLPPIANNYVPVATSNNSAEQRTAAQLTTFQYVLTEIRAARDWFLYGDLQGVLFPRRAAAERADLLERVAEQKQRIERSNAEMHREREARAAGNNIQIDFNNNQPR